MKSKFAPEEVERYYLGFDTREEFAKALDTCMEEGCLRFTNGDPDETLVGRFVRASEEFLQIEVDAAVDQS